MTQNKKYEYMSWKDRILKRKKYLLVILLVISLFLTIPIIMWIRFKPSSVSNEVEFFVNYADNDVGIDLVPVGLKYNWYLDGVIISSGTVGITGLLGFVILDADGVYVLELGAEQYNGLDYAPLITNYTWDSITTFIEKEIPYKIVEGFLLWEDMLPIANQDVTLEFFNTTTSMWEDIGIYTTDSFGFVSANIIAMLSYRWLSPFGDAPLSPSSTHVSWEDYPKHQDFTYALKTERGNIIIVFIVKLREELGLAIFHIFSFFPIINIFGGLL